MACAADVAINWAVGPASGNLTALWWSEAPLPVHTSAGGATFNPQTGAASVAAPSPSSTPSSPAGDAEDPGAAAAEPARTAMLVTHTVLLAAAVLLFFAASGLVARHR